MIDFLGIKWTNSGRVGFYSVAFGPLFAVKAVREKCAVLSDLWRFLCWSHLSVLCVCRSDAARNNIWSLAGGSGGETEGDLLHRNFYTHFMITLHYITLQYIDKIQDFVQFYCIFRTLAAL